MYYPFLLYNEKIDHRPVFADLEGDVPLAHDADATLLEGIVSQFKGREG